MPKDNDNVQIKETPATASTVIYDWAVTIVTALVVIFLLLTFFFRQVTVNGPSMNDTLENADRLIVSNFMYTPANGDIVIVTHGNKDDKNGYESAIVKRVIATEGQTIDIDYETGTVTVDGTVINEKYIKGTTIPLPNATELPLTVPEGYVFVMGDNRENSLDSRSTQIGLVPVENIIGEAVFRIYPFSSFGGLA